MISTWATHPHNTQHNLHIFWLFLILCYSPPHNTARLIPPTKKLRAKNYCAGVTLKLGSKTKSGRIIFSFVWFEHSARPWRTWRRSGPSTPSGPLEACLTDPCQIFRILTKSLLALLPLAGAATALTGTGFCPPRVTVWILLNVISLLREAKVLLLLLLLLLILSLVTTFLRWRDRLIVCAGLSGGRRGP